MSLQAQLYFYNINLAMVIFYLDKFYKVRNAMASFTDTKLTLLEQLPL